MLLFTMQDGNVAITGNTMLEAAMEQVI